MDKRKRIDFNFKYTCSSIEKVSNCFKVVAFSSKMQSCHSILGSNIHHFRMAFFNGVQPLFYNILTLDSVVTDSLKHIIEKINNHTPCMWGLSVLYSNNLTIHKLARNSIKRAGIMPMPVKDIGFKGRGADKELHYSDRPINSLWMTSALCEWMGLLWVDL